MISVSKYPFLRLLIPLILGVTFYEYIEYSISISIYLILSIPLSLFIFFTPSKIELHYSKAYIQGLAIFTFVFILGYGLHQLNNKPINLIDLRNHNGVIVKINTTPAKKKNSYKTEATILSANIDKKWIDINKDILIYNPLSDSIFWKYNDIVYVSSRIQFPNEPKNPYQFDYKEYLNKNNIYYQSYVKKTEAIRLENDNSFRLKTISESALQWTKNKIYRMVPDSSLAAIGVALVLGYQEDVDPEIKTNFSRVGAMHILAVSGLHVGIIFYIISQLLFFLDKKTGFKIIKVVLIITLLWAYAFICGMSPSIIRAALMFTILLPIIIFNVSGNVYNNMCVSAFLILLYNTDYLFDVGFQLSYAAVFGIVFLQPYLKEWFISKYWIINQAWNLTAVSLAAQLFTTPIVLHYFGQFPLSFLISNIIAVPISTAIIYWCIITIPLSFINYLQPFFSKILHFMLLILNECIIWLESIPYSFLDYLLITKFQVILIYGIIFSVIFYFLYRQVRTIHYFFIFLIIFTITITYRKYEVLNNNYVIIYNLNKTYYIEYVNNHNGINILNDSISELNYGLFIRSNHLHDGIFNRVTNNPNVLSYQNYFQVANTSFYLLNKNIIKSHSKLKVDYLLISNVEEKTLKKITEYFEFKEIIVLNNQPNKLSEKTHLFLEKHNIKHHTISIDGYWKLDL